MKESLKIYVGWDVGGWNCDQNPRSRDALCALSERSGVLALAGTPWRGNARSALCKADVVGALLALLDVDTLGVTEVVWAIDAPLAWPSAAIQLLCGVSTIPVPTEAALNPYLFRRVEMRLSELGRQPLSPVRDMIGSQSLKGLHFLRTANLTAAQIGVWEGESNGCRLIAIECYPSPCRRSPVIQRILKEIGAPAEDGDARDAACAAAIAWLFGNHLDTLEKPTPEMPQDEGWIWIPRDAFQEG